MTVSALNASSPTTATASTSASGLTSAADQQDRFMKLLVAQMKNQDPLNPMDNAQMTSQIAQINTVAGLEKLNQSVAGLLGSLQSMQAQSLVQLAGREVMVTGNRLSLAEGQARAGLELAAPADRVDLEIVDAKGQVVQSVALGASAAGIRHFSWDGAMADGSTAPDGDYRVRVAASAGGQPGAASVLVPVGGQSVIPSPGGALLDLGPAGTAAWSEVKSYL